MGIQKRLQAARRRPVFRKAGVIVGLVAIFLLGIGVGNGTLRISGHGQYSGVTGLPKTLDFSAVNQVYDTLRQNYNGTLTSSQVLDGLKHGLAESTGDPYTEYFTPKEAKQFNGDLQGQSLTGIGAQLDQDQQGNIIVMSPVPGSPAEKAGVKAKDVIVSINGESTSGMSIATAVSKIRGQKGSKVTLVLARDGQRVDLTITRDTINIPTATSKILDNNVGYIQVSQFSDATPGLVQDAADKFKAAGVTKLVLDLRDNPGGEVTAAQQISSLWLSDGTLIEQEKRGNEVVDSLQASGDSPFKGMTTVVLINAGSASASEITTLALKDNKAAYVMGEKSYGKGVVQSVIPFSDGSELKVTVAKWYSPNGTNINHKGITPDQTVQQPADATADNDAQLQAAQAYLASH